MIPTREEFFQSHLLFQTVNNQSKAKGPPYQSFFDSWFRPDSYVPRLLYRLLRSFPRESRFLGDLTRGRILSFRIRASESSFQPQLRAFA